MDEILKCFGCKKPLRKNSICITDDFKYGDGYTKYDNLTKQGWKAYEQLVNVVYGLQHIGVIDNANEIIEQLDDIVSSRP